MRVFASREKADTHTQTQITPPYLFIELVEQFRRLQTCNFLGQEKKST